MIGVEPRVPWIGRRGRLSNDRDADERSAQFAYLDLLATTLTEHEKSLDSLIERLEEISERLSVMLEEREQDDVQRAAVEKGAAETLVYMKLRINRPVEELRAILDSLKG